MTTWLFDAVPETITICSTLVQSVLQPVPPLVARRSTGPVRDLYDGLLDTAQTATRLRRIVRTVITERLHDRVGDETANPWSGSGPTRGARRIRPDRWSDWGSNADCTQSGPPRHCFDLNIVAGGPRALHRAQRVDCAHLRGGGGTLGVVTQREPTVSRFEHPASWLMPALRCAGFHYLNRVGLLKTSALRDVDTISPGHAEPFVFAPRPDSSGVEIEKDIR
ncbi:hypothetical protein ACFYOT_25280 [Saccharothrix saharensis]|uniref:hypothetical protein n=1 Tax=Saccharothrix saharensis TaxID=571190 RepID=UPI003699AC5F